MAPGKRPRPTHSNPKPLELTNSSTPTSSPSASRRFIPSGSPCVQVALCWSAWMNSPRPTVISPESVYFGITPTSARQTDPELEASAASSATASPPRSSVTGCSARKSPSGKMAACRSSPSKNSISTRTATLATAAMAARQRRHWRSSHRQARRRLTAPRISAHRVRSEAANPRGRQ